MRLVLDLIYQKGVSASAEGRAFAILNRFLIFEFYIALPALPFTSLECLFHFLKLI
jgi:hypothetical protein